MNEDRFWSKVDQSENCWVWTAAVAGGYGQYWLDGRPRPAHRVAFAMRIGPVPEGMELDHLCRNRLCVNPAHLEPVTPAENKRRQGAAKSCCPLGHSYSIENVYVAPGTSARSCRECRRRQRLESYHRRKAA